MFTTTESVSKAFTRLIYTELAKYLVERCSLPVIAGGTVYSITTHIKLALLSYFDNLAITFFNLLISIPLIKK